MLRPATASTYASSTTERLGGYEPDEEGAIW